MQIPSCEIGEVMVSPALYNGAGTIKKVEDVKEIARCEAAGAILVGSITMEERTGNAGNVLWIGPAGSLNSLGIPLMAVFRTTVSICRRWFASPTMLASPFL